MSKRITDLADASILTGSEMLEVSQVSTVIKITGVTISADGDDNSYNDSGNGFVAAGFAVGNRVKVTGFTGDVANNIVVGTITALTAGKMTIGGTEGDVIVDDAEGESVTIAKWESRRVTVDDLPGGGGGGSSDYRVGFFFTNTPEASEILLMHVFTDDVTFPDDWFGSVAVITSNPSATFTLDVKRNGVAVGTLEFSTLGVATFLSTGGDVSFTTGQYITLSGPVAPDATAAFCAVTFLGQID